MQDDDSKVGGADGTLGRIALKQVRVSRAEVEARSRDAASQTPPSSSSARKSPNPMNRLVPYLDLFWRLGDEELARLARAPQSLVESLRQQVEEVNRALGRYVDLLPRLSDDELARLTGATSKTVRFWRLSQPRHLQGDARRQASADLTPLPGPPPREPSSDSSETSSSQPRRPHEYPVQEPLPSTLVDP